MIVIEAIIDMKNRGLCNKFIFSRFKIVESKLESTPIKITTPDIIIRLARDLELFFLKNM